MNPPTTTEIDLLLHEQSEIITALQKSCKEAEEERARLARQVDVFFPRAPVPSLYMAVNLTEEQLARKAEAEAIRADIKKLGTEEYFRYIDETRERITQSMIDGTDLEASDLLVRTQAQHIVELRERLLYETREAAKAKQEAVYYKMIQKACEESELVKDEWRRFCAILQMAESDDTPAIRAIVNS